MQVSVKRLLQLLRGRELIGPAALLLAESQANQAQFDSLTQTVEAPLCSRAVEPSLSLSERNSVWRLGGFLLRLVAGCRISLTDEAVGGASVTRPPCRLSGVRGGAVPERLQPVRVGGRAVERVEGQQRGPEGELRRRSPDPQSPVRRHLKANRPVWRSAESRSTSFILFTKFMSE